MTAPEAGIVAIGVVTNARDDRSDDGWAAEASTIVLDDRFPIEATMGLEDFSHIEVIFRFHGVGDDEVTVDSRHPRGNTAWPRIGIFAQRASKRPNRIAVTVCELTGVDGRSVHVRGLDAIDGTPVLDIKPVMTNFLPRGEVRQPAWVHELMVDYWVGPPIGNDD